MSIMQMTKLKLRKVSKLSKLTHPVESLIFVQRSPRLFSGFIKPRLPLSH